MRVQRWLENVQISNSAVFKWLSELVKKVLINPIIPTRTSYFRHSYHPTSDNIYRPKPAWAIGYTANRYPDTNLFRVLCFVYAASFSYIQYVFVNTEVTDVLYFILGNPVLRCVVLVYSLRFSLVLIILNYECMDPFMITPYILRATWP
jgi:hypothetical protein